MRRHVLARSAGRLIVLIALTMVQLGCPGRAARNPRAEAREASTPVLEGGPAEARATPRPGAARLASTRQVSEARSGARVWGTDLLAGIESRFISTSGPSFLEPHPMTRVEMPDLGRAVRDPEFGTVIRRITDARPGDPASGTYGIRTIYTGTPAWNVNETLFLAHAPGVGYRLYRGGRTTHRNGPLAGEPDYSYISPMPLGGVNYPTDLERVYWSVDRHDPAAPVTLYFPNQEHKFMKLVLPSPELGTKLAMEVVHDFSAQCGRFGHGHQLITDTHHWASFDGRIWGFKCGPNPGARVFAYDMLKDLVLWEKTHDGHEEWSQAGIPVPTPSGRYFVSISHRGTRIWDRRGRQVGTIEVPAEHATMTLTPSGDLYVTTVFDKPAALSGTIVACAIPSGDCQVVAGRATGLPYPPSGTHHSGIAWANPGWVATSVVGFRPLDGRNVLNQELLLTDLRLPAAPRVARLAHHRSAREENPNIGYHYWQEPHPVISPTGCRIAFSSDWSAGRPTSEMYPRLNVFVLELPCFRPLG